MAAWLRRRWQCSKLLLLGVLVLAVPLIVSADDEPADAEEDGFACPMTV
jgi:hypothetical protein